MSDSVILSLKTLGNTESTELQSCISFTFTKDRFIPFSRIDATFLCDSEIQGITEAELTVNNVLVHKGIIDSVDYNVTSECRTIRIKSRGYSCALLTNEVKEGIHYHATPQTILEEVPEISDIDIEDVTLKDSFVYFDTDSTLWTALTYLGLYSDSTLPFIGYTNTIRYTPYSRNINITPPQDKIISFSSSNDYTKIISHVHMKDTNGTYDTYNDFSQDAIDRNIIRHRYIPLDMQWLHMPESALTSRLDYSMRYIYSDSMTYIGFNGEDISDRFSIICDNTEKSDLDIGAIMICGAKGIITTKLTTFHNRYNY